VGILGDPTNRSRFESGKGRIFPSPSDNILGCIDMNDPGTRSGSAQGASSRICEEVEDFQGGGRGAVSVPGFDVGSQEFPVLSLFREEAEVAERGGFDPELVAGELDVPAFGKTAIFVPLPASVGMTFVGGIRLIPEFLGGTSRPEGVGSGSVEKIRTHSFEFSAFPGVEEFIAVAHGWRGQSAGMSATSSIRSDRVG
jgi:hypothetical protein